MFSDIFVLLIRQNQGIMGNGRIIYEVVFFNYSSKCGTLLFKDLLCAHSQQIHVLFIFCGPKAVFLFVQESIKMRLTEENLAVIFDTCVVSFDDTFVDREQNIYVGLEQNYIIVTKVNHMLTTLRMHLGYLCCQYLLFPKKSRHTDTHTHVCSVFQIIFSFFYT